MLFFVFAGILADEGTPNTRTLESSLFSFFETRGSRAVPFCLSLSFLFRCIPPQFHFLSAVFSFAGIDADAKSTESNYRAPEHPNIRTSEHPNTQTHEHFFRFLGPGALGLCLSRSPPRPAPDRSDYVSSLSPDYVSGVV